MPTYHAKDGSSNKVWSYETNGNSVLIKWGRVGLAGQDQTQSFPNSYERDKFISKKVSEKLKKGYVEIDSKTLKKEEKIADHIGWKNKISKVCWVDKNDKNGTLEVLKAYDPQKWVFVEVMDSWSKDTTHILLNKTEQHSVLSAEFHNDKKGEHITFNRLSYPPSGYADGVREMLKSIVQKVAAIVIKKFGMVVRKLTDDVQMTDTEAADIAQEVTGDRSDAVVIRRFAALGHRILEL